MIKPNNIDFYKERVYSLKTMLLQQRNSKELEDVIYGLSLAIELYHERPNTVFKERFPRYYETI